MPKWSDLPKHYRQWRELRAWERRVLVLCGLALPPIWLAVRLLPFNRVQHYFAHAAAPSPAAALPEGFTAVEYAQHCADLTGIAARHGMYSANCLHQSLALCWILRRDRLPARLKIGVHDKLADFRAHAWVELDGIALGQVLPGYVPFPDRDPARKGPMPNFDKPPH